MFFDSTYLLYFLPAFLLAIIAQIWISLSYRKNSKVSPGNGITGENAAYTIQENEDFPVSIEIHGPKLSDHFDPVRDVVKLSNKCRNSSVADIAIVAHEFGHVSQKFSNSLLFKFRTALVPIVNIGSRIGYGLIIIGLLFSILQLANLGLILFAGTTLFAFITVPIEIDATLKGLSFIKKYNLIPKKRMSGAKSVLFAASLTYVAALFTSLINLFYYYSLIRRRN
jgi:uncharacterized protein